MSYSLNFLCPLRLLDLIVHSLLNHRHRGHPVRGYFQNNVSLCLSEPRGPDELLQVIWLRYVNGSEPNQTNELFNSWRVQATVHRVWFRVLFKSHCLLFLNQLIHLNLLNQFSPTYRLMSLSSNVVVFGINWVSSKLMGK